MPWAAVWTCSKSRVGRSNSRRVPIRWSCPSCRTGMDERGSAIPLASAARRGAAAAPRAETRSAARSASVRSCAVHPALVLTGAVRCSAPGRTGEERNSAKGSATAEAREMSAHRRRRVIHRPRFPQDVLSSRRSRVARPWFRRAAARRAGRRARGSAGDAPRIVSAWNGSAAGDCHTDATSVPRPVRSAASHRRAWRAPRGRRQA